MPDHNMLYGQALKLCDPETNSDVSKMLLLNKINNTLNHFWDRWKKEICISEKHIFLSHLFIKVTIWAVSTFSKKRLRHKHFLVNFAKFLRTALLKNTLGQLLLSLLLQTLHYWVFLSAFYLTWCLFIDLLVHLVYALLLLIAWLQW